MKMNWSIWKPLVVLVLPAVFLVTGCKRQQEAPPPPVPEVKVVTIEPQTVVLHSELPGRTSGFLVAEIRPQVNGLLQKRHFTEGTQVKAGQILYEIDPAPYEAAFENATANLLAMKKAAEKARAMLETSKAGLNRHQAVLELAKTNLQRYENLVKTQAVSAMQRDQAVADVKVADSALRVAEAQVISDQQGVAAADAAIKQAEAAVKTARINLDYTKILSVRVSKSANRQETTSSSSV